MKTGTRTRQALVTGILLAVAAAGPPSGTAFAGSAPPSGKASGGSGRVAAGRARSGPPAAGRARPAAGRARSRPAAASPDLTVLLKRVHVLYLRAEEAGEAYDAATDRLRRQRAAVSRLAAELSGQRAALAAERDRAGQIARAQYRAGGVSPYAQLLLSGTPEDLFSRTRYLRRAAGGTARLITELKQGETRTAALGARAREAAARAARLQRTQRDTKRKAETRLVQAKRMVAGLTGVQRTGLQRLERAGVAQAQRRLLASGRLGKLGGSALTPSPAGYRAVRFAYEQLGKPYVWGGAGPDAFDCSGLTSQAWANAGVVIPRVSQQQWAQLAKVPLDALRPGDLIIYFRGATHVAIYVGDGLVIQAPRPGAYVKISPIASNSPILGAVRPDPDDGPMDDDYEPPEGAAGGDGQSITPFG